MKKLVVFDGQLQPNLGGQFKLESGGQFTPKLLVNLNWKVVVNLTVFSKQKRKIEEEREARFQEEVNKFKQLKKNAKRWQKTVEIRNYIQAVETNAIKTNTLTPELIEWIKWANNKADWYDPLIQKEDDLLDDSSLYD